MPTKRTWLILDVSNMAWRAYHTQGYLSFDGQPTGVIYGVLSQVEYLRKNLGTDALVFCFDAGCDKRREIDPAYKANRRDKLLTPEEKEERKQVARQIALLKNEILPGVGYRNLFSAPGFEADDVIASVCCNCDEDQVIVSSDKDLLQMLRSYTKVWNASSKKIVTKDNFREEYGTAPVFWPQVKAIAGCKTDNVPGLPGVGEVTAAKFIEGKLKESSSKYDAIDKWIHGYRFALNCRLVRLPFKGCPDFRPEADERRNSAWRKMCAKYGMKSLVGGLL